MTETHARTTANIAIAAVAAGAAFFVVRTPARRRLTWRLARHYAVGPLVAWAATTVRHAWDESGGAPPRAMGRQPVV